MRRLLGLPADTGFLLVPLAMAVFSTGYGVAQSLAKFFPGEQNGEFEFMLTSNFFNFMVAIPGVATFAWQTRLRRLRMRPFDPAVFPAAAELLGRVIGGAKVTVMLGPHLGRRAVTGGSNKDPYIAFGPELLTAPVKGGSEVLEAVARHELAHVQNQDLMRYRLATALRVGFYVVSAVVTLLVLLFPTDSPPWTVLGRIAIGVIAVELFVRAFYRAREHQADVRAGEFVHAALPATASPPTRGGWLARHPDAGLRRSRLDDPGEMLAFSWPQALAGGFFLGITLASVQRLADVVFPDSAPTGLAHAGAVALLVGVPIGFFLSIGVWRHTWRACLTGAPARPWLIAVAFGAGVHGGTIASLARGAGLPIRLDVLLVVLASTGVYCAMTWAMTRAVFQRDPDATPTRAYWRWSTVPVLAGVAYVIVMWQLTTS